MYMYFSDNPCANLSMCLKYILGEHHGQKKQNREALIRAFPHSTTNGPKVQKVPFNNRGL